VCVTAPKECKIWREELYQTIQANKQAAESVPVMPKANLKSMVQKLNK
jgi:sRNA-binding carbon storage regulator CsrA